MKVENINQNFRTPYAGQQRKSPQFTGMSSLEQKITELLPANKTLSKMKKLEWLKGEIGGILITALGTGLVAPIFIGFNPFVKAPENATPEKKKEVNNTKWYTALRQPISAILAILFQVSALTPINKWLDYIINTPEYSKNFGIHVDQSEINGKSFVETTVKQELKKEGIKKPGWLKAITKGYSKIKEERKAYDDLFDSRVDEKIDTQIEKVANKFAENGKITIGKRKLDNKTLSELINKQIDEYIKDAQKLKIDNEGLAYYTEKAKMLVGNEEHLRNIFTDIPHDYKQLETYLKNLLVKETNPDVRRIIQDVLDHDEDLRESRISRTLERIDKIKDMCKGEYTSNKYLNAMSTRNAELDRIITKLKLNKIKEPEKATDTIITDSIRKMARNCQFNEKDNLLKSILHDTDTFDFDSSKLWKKIHKDITKGYKKLIENKYKSFKQITQVIIGVCITLPITCNALNWVYPRFMEIVFPGLSGVKKSQNKTGGDK